MITKFAVTNYRGFSKRIEWDLSSPSNYAFNNHAIKNNTIKNGIIYGANGCGKTNLSLALFDIENHLSSKWKKSDYYNNFIYTGNAGGLVDFEYTFAFGGDVLLYCYSKNRKGVLVSEQLYINNNLFFEKREGYFFIDKSLFNISIDKTIEDNLKNNANNISIVNFLLMSYPFPSGHCLLRLKDFVDSMLWFRSLDVREFIGLETNVYYLDEYIINNNLIDDFKQFLFDVSEQDFDFIPYKSSNKILLCCFAEGEIPFTDIASTGTKSLQLLYFWINRIKQASFVFIDEFDAFYHYNLSFEVCKKLFEGNDCQIFTSTHNTHLLTNELLRPDCYFLMKNNKILPLCKCTDKELRQAHNIEKIYKSGAFDVE